MFTTGSKLFLGATVLSLIGAIVVGSTVGGQGTIIALIVTTIIFAFLAGINLFIRDGNVSSMEPDATVTAAANTVAPRGNIWPLLAAIGLGVVILGYDTRPMIVVVGILLLLIASLEWVMQGWAERASADPAYNARIRRGVLGPLEYPLLAAIGAVAIVYSFSRIMLFIDKAGGPVVFVIAAALIVLAGYLIASKPSIKKGTITAVAAIVGLGLVSTGAVMAIDGQRSIEHHATPHSEPDVCNEPGKDDHVDKRAPQDVTIKASLAGHVVLQDGKLAAFSQGLRGARPDITLTKGTVNNILFVNEDSQPRRFKVNMGEFVDSTGKTPTETPVKCTTLVPVNGKVMLSLKFDRPSAASQANYTIVAVGVEDQAITVLVP